MAMLFSAFPAHTAGERTPVTDHRDHAGCGVWSTERLGQLRLRTTAPRAGVARLHPVVLAPARDGYPDNSALYANGCEVSAAPSTSCGRRPATGVEDDRIVRRVTWRSAKVSSTTPRLRPQMPPVAATLWIRITDLRRPAPEGVSGSCRSALRGSAAAISLV